MPQERSHSTPYQCSFLLSGTRHTGEVVKENALTVWVRVGPRIIQRHLRKHQCWLV